MTNYDATITSNELCYKIGSTRETVMFLRRKRSNCLQSQLVATYDNHISIRTQIYLLFSNWKYLRIYFVLIHKTVSIPAAFFLNTKIPRNINLIPTQVLDIFNCFVSKTIFFFHKVNNNFLFHSFLSYFKFNNKKQNIF